MKVRVTPLKTEVATAKEVLLPLAKGAPVVEIQEALPDRIVLTYEIAEERRAEFSAAARDVGFSLTFL